MRLCDQNQRLFPLLLLLMVITTHGVLGRRRRRARGRSSPHAPGPNMCKVQQVLGTKEKFFTHCIAKHLKMICERPTIDVWECCSGFVKQRGKTGCTGEKPLGNIVETARDLRLNGFVQMTGTTGQRDDLSNHGAYTVFAPTDEAMWDASPKKLTELISDENSLPLLKYHTAPGRLNISNFVKRNQQFVTLYDGQKIRINKYAYGVATVNCARIIRPDEKATNGIVHVIDKVLSPHDVDSTLAERVEKDDRFSQFHLAMLVADLARRLNSERGSFTVLAPTNEAFARLPSDLLDQILTDADTAEKVMKRHIVRGVYCADAIVVAVGLKTMDDSRLLFRCKRDGLRVNEARVIHPDITASNGVMHGIDTVLLPDSVKKTTQLLEDMRLSKFMELVAAAGLNMTLDNGGDVTVFSPTDQALGNIPPKYMASLRNEPRKMKELLQYHMVPGKLEESTLIGDTNLDTLANMALKIKVTVLRDGVKLDKASLQNHGRECRNAVIHRVDKVLIPPDNSLMDELMGDPNLSEFWQMMDSSGVSEELIPFGSYTVLAPTNNALSKLDQRHLAKMKANRERLKQFVLRHVILRTVLKCAVPEDGTYNIKSMQGDETHFTFDWKDRLVVNKHSRAVSDDILTSNGILYKIDHVIPCSCEKLMRTRRGQYLSAHRYRRRY